MIKITTEVGKTLSGRPLYRHQLFYNDNTNYLVKAQSYFTKAEKKAAKIKNKK